MGVHDGHRARLKRRFEQEGLDAFQPHEALELLLFHAVARRDVNPFLAWLIGSSTKPKEIRPGFWTSLHAAYTKPELEQILNQTPLTDVIVTEAFFGLCVSGNARV